MFLFYTLEDGEVNLISWMLQWVCVGEKLQRQPNCLASKKGLLIPYHQFFGFIYPVGQFPGICQEAVRE